VLSRTLILFFIQILLLSEILVFDVSAQIIVQSNTLNEDMVEMIIGEGVYYENVAYQGASIAKATFENGNTTNLGLDAGIILCTGNPNLILGPNENCSVTGVNSSPGYPLLSAISSPPYPTEDASILEFDIIPESDTLKFRYVFGSEEYNEFIFKIDVFGCFVSGPDPMGGYYSEKNIAIIPGSDNLGITTNTINNGYSNCGVISTGPCNNCEYYIDNTNGQTIQYDGFTHVMEAWLLVVPCETYHVIIGVADGLDPILDSGVFIEKSDYVSPKMAITVENLSPDSTISLVEGCEEAILTFKIPDSDYSPVSAYFDFSGSTANPTAYPDGDFEEAIPTEVYFEEGQDSLSINISPAYDGFYEGDEILQIIVEYTLTCLPKYDTIEIVISDYIDMVTQTTPDTMTCQGEEIELWLSVESGVPGYTFEWLGLPFVNDTITVSPDLSTWYYVNVNDQCLQTEMDSIYVDVEYAPEVDLGADTIICIGDEIVLQPLPGNFINYLWSTGDTTASINIGQPGAYSLTAYNECGEAEDEIVIDQWPYPDPNLGPDLELCFGETAFLQATPGFISYTWQDNSTDDYYTVMQSGLYVITVEDIHGCTGADSVLAFIGNIVQLEDSLALCEGSSATIFANSGFDYYTWSNNQTGTDSIVVDEEGWYSVNVAYLFGCPSEDSAFVESTPVPYAEITGDDILCEGDTLWLFAPDGKYEYYWNNEWSASNELLVTSGGNYNLKMINDCGEDEESKFVQLSPLPNVNLGEDLLLFPGESVTLDAGTFQTYQWNNDPDLNSQYYSVTFDDINVKDSIWVMVFDGFCENKDGIIIEILNVRVPNVFTPNGDGYNDRFQPIDDLTGISNHKVMVFNRWGESIWESSNFNEGWDGRRNGQPVSDGIYYWILEVWYGKEEMKKIYKGSLTILH